MGTAQIGFDYGVANTRGRPDDGECNRLLSRAVERGVLHWDTARNYGDAEERIGRFLSQCPRRDEIQIVSKLPTPPVSLPVADLTKWVTSETNACLNALGVDQLHGWLVHDATAIRAHGNWLWDAMLAQIDRGAVRHVGVSVYDQEQLRHALECPSMTVVQLTLNLLDHRFVDSGLLAECHRRDVTIYARSVLLQGVFAMAIKNVPPRLSQLVEPLKRLSAIVSRYDLRPLEVALPFVLSHEDVDFAVIGVDDVSQLDDNLTRASNTLPDGFADELNTALVGMPLDVIEPRRWVIE